MHVLCACWRVADVPTRVCERYVHVHTRVASQHTLFCAYGCVSCAHMCTGCPTCAVLEPCGPWRSKCLWGNPGRTASGPRRCRPAHRRGARSARTRGRQSRGGRPLRCRGATRERRREGSVQELVSGYSWVQARAKHATHDGRRRRGWAACRALVADRPACVETWVADDESIVQPHHNARLAHGRARQVHRCRHQVSRPYVARFPHRRRRSPQLVEPMARLVVPSGQGLQLGWWAVALPPREKLPTGHGLSTRPWPAEASATVRKGEGYAMDALSH